MESFPQVVTEPNAVPQQQLVINVRNVTLVDNDNNKVTILNDLSLDVPRGTIFALLGISGCGKTSLIQCILGNLKPTTGSVNVFGLPADSSHLNALGATVGYMPQDITLCPKLTIGATLVKVGHLYGLDGIQLSERCQCLVQLLKLPQTDQLVGGLSVDQKRRVSLATALIHKPALLLLDEPTVGVEPLLSKSIWQDLVELCEADQVTVLYTTKSIEEAKCANLIGLMHHGNILAQGSLTELLVRFKLVTLETVSLQQCGNLSTEQSLLSAMSSNINHLPDLCLEIILSYVPIRDHRQVKLVCSKWKWLQRRTALKVAKLTLVISCSNTDFASSLHPHANRVLNEDGTLMYPQQTFPSFDSVHYEWLDLTALIGLTVTFANVTTLEMIFKLGSMHQLVGVTLLLRRWHNKLITFKLSIDSAINRIPASAFEPLFEAINALSSLKHLSLQFQLSHFSSLGENTVQLELPILARLDTFFFNSGDTTDVLLDSIRTSAVPNGTLRLSYDYCAEIIEIDLDPYYRLGRNFCGQFERTPDVCLSIDGQVEKYCAHFTLVTSLRLNIPYIDQLDIRSLFDCLSQLTQLVNFELFIERFVIEEDEEEEVLLSRLPSIKTLELWVESLSNHTDIALLNIPHTMPNLQLIKVCAFLPEDGDSHCGVCRFDAGGLYVSLEVLHHCISHAFISLADCPVLHTIQIIIIDDDDTVAFSSDNLTVEDLRQPLNIN